MKDNPSRLVTIMLKHLPALIVVALLAVSCGGQQAGEQTPEQQPRQQPQLAPAVDAATQAVSEERTASGVLQHYPSDVQSSEAWYGHNFIVDGTPVLPTEEVTSEALTAAAGKHVVVSGTWHPGTKWEPSEAERMSMPHPVGPNTADVIRGDGILAAELTVTD